MKKLAKAQTSIAGRPLGTEAFLALVHRTSAGPMKTKKRDMSRGEARRRAMRDE
jgi:hypothetical protein